MNAYQSFLVKFLALSALAFACILGVNIFIDPLWYFSGNRYSGMTIAFDEREAKLNHYLKDPAGYDCIIFGSSTVMMLDASLIKGHHCYNFSFKRAGVSELVDYAKYIKHLGLSPSLIIVGVDLYDFQIDNLEDLTPAYLRQLKPPPGALETYLTWSAFGFSLQTILGLYPDPLNYGKDFKGVIAPMQRVLPVDWRENLPPPTARYYSVSDPMTDANFKYFRELRDIFPQATYIGFMPLRSVALTKKLNDAGQLEPSLRMMADLGKMFDRFYDFTTPSQFTANAAASYDGYHFGPDAEHHIADELNGEGGDNFFEVSGKTYEQYRDDYTRRLDAIAGH